MSFINDDFFLKESPSILSTVKKALGITIDAEGFKEFDLDILLHINNAISILSQIGVNSGNGFTVLSDSETFEDYLGPDAERLGPNISLYLVYQTKLGWDPPQSSIVTEIYKEKIRELETRIMYMVDPSNNSFEEEVIQNGWK